MKKLKLSLANIEGAEVLSRENLRSIIGGNPPQETGCLLKCKDSSEHVTIPLITVPNCNEGVQNTCAPYDFVSCGNCRTYIFD